MSIFVIEGIKCLDSIVVIALCIMFHNFTLNRIDNILLLNL